MIGRAMIAGAAALLSACGGGGERASAPPTGEQLFGQCAVCHTAAPPDTPAGKMRLIGPNLYGVFGRHSAQIEGYSYSKAMRSTDLVWDDATLDRWIENPQMLVPNNRMAFAGEPDPQKRAAIIDYLKSLQ